MVRPLLAHGFREWAPACRFPGRTSMMPGPCGGGREPYPKTVSDDASLQRRRAQRHPPESALAWR